MRQTTRWIEKLPVAEVSSNVLDIGSILILDGILQGIFYFADRRVTRVYYNSKLPLDSG